MYTPPRDPILSAMYDYDDDNCATVSELLALRAENAALRLRAESAEATLATLRRWHCAALVVYALCAGLALLVVAL